MFVATLKSMCATHCCLFELQMFHQNQSKTWTKLCFFSFFHSLQKDDVSLKKNGKAFFEQSGWRINGKHCFVSELICCSNTHWPVSFCIHSSSRSLCIQEFMQKFMTEKSLKTFHSGVLSNSCSLSTLTLHPIEHMQQMLQLNVSSKTGWHCVIGEAVDQFSQFCVSRDDVRSKKVQKERGKEQKGQANAAIDESKNVSRLIDKKQRFLEFIWGWQHTNQHNWWSQWMFAHHLHAWSSFL